MPTPNQTFTFRTTLADMQHLTTLTEAGRLSGHRFATRSQIVKAALAFAASNLSAFSAYL